VDYITVTAKRRLESATLLSEAKANLQREAQEGNEVKKWRGLGYSGLVCGAASYGVGPQGVIARITGGSSKSAWRTLYQSGTRCTRIDVQCTVVFDVEPEKRIAEDWQAVVQRWSELKNAKEPKLRSGPFGPETIEIGSRQSERFGRIYDKRKESKLDHYRNAVRFEVEYKGSLAGVVARSLIDGDPAPTSTIPHVTRFFRKYAVSLGLPIGQPQLICSPPRLSDASSKLRYLHSSIRPLVQFLISHGRIHEIYQALELPAPPEISSNFQPAVGPQIFEGANTWQSTE